MQDFSYKEVETISYRKLLSHLKIEVIYFVQNLKIWTIPITGKLLMVVPG